MWVLKIYCRVYTHRLSIPGPDDIILMYSIPLPFVPFPGLRIKTRSEESRRQWFHIEKITWNDSQYCFETWLSPDKTIPAVAARNSSNHVTVFHADTPEYQEVVTPYLKAGWWLTNKLSSDLVNPSARESSHCFI